jgi:hypothetical protein
MGFEGVRLRENWEYVTTGVEERQANLDAALLFAGVRGNTLE